MQALVLTAEAATGTGAARALALRPLLGRPLLDHVLRALDQAGADPVTICVGQDAVASAFAGRGGLVRHEASLGSGGAILAAREAIARHSERPLLVLSGRLPLLRGPSLVALLAAHRKAAAAATLLSAPAREGDGRARLRRDAQGLLRALVTTPTAAADAGAGHEVAAGAWVFEVAALLRLLDRPAAAVGGVADLVGLLLEAGLGVQALPVLDPRDALAVETLADLAAAGELLRARRLDALLASGVTIEDPGSTYVDSDVVVEPDAVIRPFCFLEGRTLVRSGASVGPFVRLVDTEIGPGAQVLDHCLLRQCQVGAEASVGPFAHLRPETRLEARAKVGNFVELKKTHLGEGSRAPHLSYLGDAEIGPGVNVGAGTITCNYDGVQKHPTQIEAGAFIGSHSTLVAPVRIGAGAYLAAGSAITDDVPADALALGRSRQVIKRGWAAERRKARGEKARS